MITREHGWSCQEVPLSEPRKNEKEPEDTSAGPVGKREGAQDPVHAPLQADTGTRAWRSTQGRKKLVHLETGP